MAVIWKTEGKKKSGSVLNSLFVRRCACSPRGEATLLFHQIKWSGAVPFQEEPIKQFKEVYYCHGLWNHSHRIHCCVCFNRGVNVCTLALRKLIKAVDSSFPFVKQIGNYVTVLHVFTREISPTSFGAKISRNYRKWKPLLYTSAGFLLLPASSFYPPHVIASWWQRRPLSTY